MKNILCILICIWFITSCVTDNSENLDKDTASSSNSGINKTERKSNTTEALSIAEINQRLNLDNKFKNVEGIELNERDVLNTVGVIDAVRYNYTTRENINTGISAKFYLALYQYKTADDAVTALQYYMEVAETSNGFWRFHDFLIPIGKNILWLHGDCTLPEQNWDKAIEAITQTLSEVPKSIACKCSESCVYE